MVPWHGHNRRGMEDKERRRVTWGVMRRIGAVTVAAGLSACATPEFGPSLDAKGARVDSTLFIAPEGPETGAGRFDLPTGPWQRARVEIQSTIYRALPVAVTCDGPAHLGQGKDRAFIRPGGHQHATASARGRAPLRLDLEAEVSRCVVSWGDDHRVTLERPENVTPEVARIDRMRNACVIPATTPRDPLAAAFYAASDLSRTCASPVGRIETLDTPIEALAARLEALTGTRLRCRDLVGGDPYMPLDFSNAPKLDLIVISSLHIRADFCGALTQQALRFHAARGTPVRILVTESLQSGKDRTFWDALAARWPNVQIQYYEWAPRGLATPATEFDAFQRGNHVKLTIALSSEPGRSWLITGGRNLHDGFFFDRPVPLDAYPELRSFDENGRDALAWFASFEDLDLVVRDDAVVAQVAAHFAKLWRRDAPGQVLRAASEPGRAGVVPEDGVMRHFISAPFADGRALEAEYLRMIDAARREIIIVSPFLYPPESIDRALLRARKRGVSVDIVTRMVSTEPAGPFTWALTKDYVNRRFDDFTIHDYPPRAQMVHSKILVIDGRLAVSSSVNFNARSFLHDTENGLVFLDRKMAARLETLAASYRARAQRVRAPVPLNGRDRLIVGLPGLWPYF